MEKKVTNSVDIFKPIKKLSKKFHLTLFFVFIVACLSGGILFINYTIKEGSIDPNYVPSISAGNIDQVTLDRLNGLHTSAQGAPAYVFPEGRVNPFGE